MAIDTKRLKSIVVGSAGNLVEWYDWSAYAVLSLYFAPSFFPSGDQTAQLLGTSVIFALGFLTRPPGAWLMGRYSDTYGRKAGLTLSVALMCAGSLLIAFTPGHDEIGIFAPIILVLARLIQGVSIGGEYGASATYLSEMATRKHRGFWSSIQYTTLIAGQLLAFAVLLILQMTIGDAALKAGGWRIAFVIGAILALAVYALRRRMAETASFEAMSKDRPASTARALWKQHPREFMIVTIISAGGGLSFYAYTTYLQKFLVNTAGLPAAVSTQVMTFAQVYFMLIQPIWGLASDYLGRRPILLFFGVASILMAVPVFTELSTVKDPWVAFGIVLIPLTIMGAYTSVAGVFKAELFPPHIRTLGVALPYAIGNTIFAGTGESVALLFKQSHFEPGFYWYVAGVMSLATIGFLMLPETRDTSKILED